MPDPFWHKTGRWACMVRLPSGKRAMEYEKTGLAEKQKGKAFAWAEQAALAASQQIKVDGEPTMTELRLMYLSACLRRIDEGEATRHTYDGHRKQLMLVCKSRTANERLVGDLPASEFTPKVIDRLVENWKEDGRAATTIRNRCTSALAMLNWAASPQKDRGIRKLIETNPIEGYELVKKDKRANRYMDASEVKAFMEFVDSEAAKVKGKPGRFERLTALLIHVVVDTGCRPGELCVSRWDHYHAERRAIILPPYEIVNGKKVKMHKTASTGRDRLIMLTRETAARIEWEMVQPDRHPTHIFCHRIGSRQKERDVAPHGVPWNSNALCKRIRKIRTAAIKAGVLSVDEGIGRFHLYRLRHTVITDSVNNGAISADVARLSGNSIKTIEDVYLAENADRLRGVADRLQGGK